MSTHKHSRVSCYGAISAYKCSRVPIALQNHIHACSWAPMIVHCPMAPRSWVFMVTHECSWAIMSFHKYPISTHEYSWAALSSHECSLLLMIPLEQPWILMSFVPWGNGNSWELRSSHDHGVMGPWTIIRTHSHLLSSITMLMIAHECWLALMGADESSWVLIRAHEWWHASLNNKQKMLTFNMISL